MRVDSKNIPHKILISSCPHPSPEASRLSNSQFSFLNNKKIHAKKESLFFLKNKNPVPNRTATAKIAKMLARLKYFRFGNCLNCRFQE